MFLKAYRDLSAEAFRNKKLKWKTRPNMHDFAHMVDYMKARRRNPNAHHGFGEEDFVGKVLKVASSTHGTSHESHVAPLPPVCVLALGATTTTHAETQKAS